jgi:hypothetical protein
MDLRDDKEIAKSKHSDKRPAFVSYNQGLAMAGKVGAVKYVECSAKTHKGLTTLFDEAILAVIIPTKKTGSGKCHLL